MAVCKPLKVAAALEESRALPAMPLSGAVWGPIEFSIAVFGRKGHLLPK